MNLLVGCLAGPTVVGVRSGAQARSNHTTKARLNGRLCRCSDGAGADATEYA